ncbi:MAG TPA: hypothetical protein PK397_11820 [Ignavibacteriaceae bacterium]|nr:hypothetical protein [Ignavibacteriaceae bacterium]
MKNGLKIAFIIIYLFGSTGVVLSRHLCSGEVHSVKIAQLTGGHTECKCSDSCCESSCCEIPKGCCTNETEIVKIDDVYTGEIKTKFNPTGNALPLQSINPPGVSEKCFLTPVIVYYSPPKSPLNILYSVFLI